MTPEHAKVVATYLCQILEHEFDVTKKVLASLPDSKMGWKPHEKGRGAGELAWHLVTSDVWFLEGIAAGQFAPPGEGTTPATVAGILSYYDQKYKPALAKVAALSGDHLAQVVEFYGFKLPNIAYLGFCERHMIHHRGQLAAYLRAMGERVPSIYGGSADEPFEMAASG